MLMIAICDDEIEVGAEVERIVTDVLRGLKVTHDIDVYFSGKELQRKIKEGVYYDLIFLDIMFAKEEINGVDVGKFIREICQNNLTSIVYMSWSSRYSMQLFEVRPLNFLIKPLNRKDVYRVFQTYLKLHKIWAKEFSYKKKVETFKVQASDIVYLESFDRKCILQMVKGKRDEFYGSLKKIYKEQLEGMDFLFIHASYVVNYDYIASLSSTEVLLTDGSTLQISQSKRREVREKYFEIMKGRRKS